MNITTLVAAAALALASTAVAAQEAAPITLVLASSADSLSTTFERSVSGLFLDTYTFTPAAVAGPVSVRLAPTSGAVSFFAALLNDQGFSFLPESGVTSFEFSSTVSANVPLSLQVFGYAGNADALVDAAGAYRGTVTVQAVAAIPEPETYALMLAGLAWVGASVRRRSKAGSCGLNADRLGGADGSGTVRGCL